MFLDGPHLPLVEIERQKLLDNSLVSGNEQYYNTVVTESYILYFLIEWLANKETGTLLANHGRQFIKNQFK